MALPPDLNTCYLEYENKSSCESNQSAIKCIRRAKIWPTDHLVVATAALLKRVREKIFFSRLFIDAKFHNSENLHLSLQLDKRARDHMNRYLNFCASTIHWIH